MSVRSGQVVTTEFTTRSFSTGGATVADSTPTGSLYLNGTANAAVVTVTSQTGGKYKASVTLPVLATDDMTSIIVSATVGGISDNAKVWEDSCDLQYGGDGVIAAKCANGASIAEEGTQEIINDNMGQAQGNLDIIVTDYARRGDQMDLIDAPNATALDAIATTVESHLLDEGDSQMLINAIVGAIGNTNMDEAALVAAIRADIERNDGTLALIFADYMRRTDPTPSLASQAKTDVTNSVPTASQNATATAAQITTDHGSGSYHDSSAGGDATIDNQTKILKILQANQ